MTTPRSTRVVLCDDHEMLLEGLEAALAGHGLTVAGTTTDPEEALRLVVRLRPDVCILDVTFPDGDGVDAAGEIVRAAPDTKVLLLSANLTADIVRRGIDVGVGGFVSKTGSVAQIIRGVNRLLSGQVVVEASLLREAMAARTAVGPRAVSGDPLSRLTGREREILECIVNGDNTTAMAARLQISPSTARAHVQSLLTKLGVHTRPQAVAIAAGRHRAERMPTPGYATRRTP